jgi:hypothetical protein
MLIAIILIIAAFVGGFLVGRNNPNISAVNNLISSGKAVYDVGSKIIKKL